MSKGHKLMTVEEVINELLVELGYKSKGDGDEDNGDQVNLTLVMIALLDVVEERKKERVDGMAYLNGDQN